MGRSGECCAPAGLPGLVLPPLSPLSAAGGARRPKLPRATEKGRRCRSILHLRGTRPWEWCPSRPQGSTRPPAATRRPSADKGGERAARTGPRSRRGGVPPPPAAGPHQSSTAPAGADELAAARNTRPGGPPHVVRRADAESGSCASRRQSSRGSRAHPPAGDEAAVAAGGWSSRLQRSLDGGQRHPRSLCDGGPAVGPRSPRAPRHKNPEPNVSMGHHWKGRFRRTLPLTTICLPVVQRQAVDGSVLLCACFRSFLAASRFRCAPLGQRETGAAFAAASLSPVPWARGRPAQCSLKRDLLNALFKRDGLEETWIFLEEGPLHAAARAATPQHESVTCTLSSVAHAKKYEFKFELRKS